MMNRKGLVIAGSVLGLMMVGCEEKAPAPKPANPAPKAPTGATVPAAPSGATTPTAPTTPPAAPK